jgi:hypothetical protein
LMTKPVSVRLVTSTATESHPYFANSTHRVSRITVIRI